MNLNNTVTETGVAAQTRHKFLSHAQCRPLKNQLTTYRERDFFIFSRGFLVLLRLASNTIHPRVATPDPSVQDVTVWTESLNPAVNP